MKGMDLLCSSPASTAVISGMQAHPSTVRPRRSTSKSYGFLSPVPCSCSSLSPISPGTSREKHGKSSSHKQSYVHLNDLYTSSCNTSSSSSSTTRLLADSGSSLIDSERSPSLPSRHQVVVLRVSLHCKGCAAKVGRHISRMQGVTSFSIDIETKKVTITGDVTPLGVLASVSKVKNAQFWPSAASASSSVPAVR